MNVSEKEELEIHILKNGEVKVDIKGGQGKSIAKYIKLFEEILGTLKDGQSNLEYYEPKPETRIDIQRQ